MFRASMKIMFSLWTMMRQARISSLLFLTCTIMLVQGGCPQQCSCPASPPSCPPGVSWVTDSCGCCKVCIKQYNQDCSPSQPCDHIKGLHCHLGLGGDPETGL